MTTETPMALTPTVDHLAAARTALRAPFASSDMGLLPKQMKKDDQDRGECKPGSKYSGDGKFCGGYHARSIHLDFVGHAAVTKRFLDVDPEWNWEPLAVDDDGLPRHDHDGGLWIKLTLLGVTRLGYGDAPGKRAAAKELIGDALRNAAMRFGVALDLWHKGEFATTEAEADTADAPAETDWIGEATNAPSVDAILAIWRMAKAQKVPKATLDKITDIGAKRRAKDEAGQ